MTETTAAERDKRLLTVPNVISVIRLIVLTPLFAIVLIGFRAPFVALIVAIVLGVSDYVDGQIARRFHQGSRFGRIIDPIADRISQLVVAVSMVIVGYIPWWMFAVLVLADLALGIALVASHQHGSIPVRWIGRIRTALLMVGLPLVLLVHAFFPHVQWLVIGSLALVGLAVLLHAISNTLYTVSLANGTARDVRDSHPAERP
jgi:cardiolipin synthase